jgi:fatty acid desaturase
MMYGMRIMLLTFAMVGFGAAGAAMAVARYRLLGEGERDFGLVAIAAVFAIFGSLCTIAASGLFGVIAFGGVVAWCSYLLTGQRLGLFSIETEPGPPPELETTEHHSR